MEKRNPKYIKLLNKVKETLAPRKRLSVEEWALEHRRLPNSSAESGPLRLSRTPYALEIAHAFVTTSFKMSEIHTVLNGPEPDIRTDEEHHVIDIVMKTSAQVAKTELLLTVMFYCADYDPSPMLLMLPTKEFARKFSNERIRPNIVASPRLKDIFLGVRAKATAVNYSFNGGNLAIVGSNVATDLASRPIKYLLNDEAARNAESAGDEGSPLDLARKRQTTFSDTCKTMITSTPTDADSAIEVEYDRGTQEQYAVPCPFCEKYQYLRHTNLQWEKDEDGNHLFDTAVYVCEHCNEDIQNHHLNGMLAKGKFVANNRDKGLRNQCRSFHVNELYSPFTPWSKFARNYVKAKSGTSLDMQAFYNTSLGLAFAQKSETPEWSTVYGRREDYKPGEIPDERVSIITAAIDVQADGYFRYGIWGWAEMGEGWCLDDGMIEGSVTDKAAQTSIIELLQRTYRTPDGRLLTIRKAWLDVGDQTKALSNWVDSDKANLPNLIKGVGRARTQIDTLIQPPATKAKNKVWKACVDVYKEELMNNLKRSILAGPNPGYQHFGDMPEQYFRELCSEHIVTEFDKKTNRPKRYWRKISESQHNEALDIWVYSRACYDIVGANKWSKASWERIREDDRKRLLADKRRNVSQEPRRNSRVRPDTMRNDAKGGGGVMW